MSASDDRWAELSSRNERLIRQPDQRHQPDDHRPGAGPSGWAGLASHDERLTEIGEPLRKLASSRRGQCDLRQVAGAA
jgi:hypothetical protein